MDNDRRPLGLVIRMRRRILLVSLLMCGCVSSATVSMTSPSSSSSNDFAKPTKVSDRYDNPKSFKNWGGIPGFGSILKWQFTEKDNENVPKDEKELNKTIPVHTLKNFISNGPSKLFAAWLGHATMLVNMEGANFLTDPIWAARASFSSWVGAKRYRPPPMEMEDLPKIDFAVISHDHYDHLDSNAVQKITQMNTDIRWFVPLGMKDWMKSIGIESDGDHPNRVTEMNWGESTTFEVRGKQYEIWCVPAQHWGQRGIFDRNKRLWSGWAVIGPSRRFYYSGDTGFCDDEFSKIGKKLGPFDLAAIPIGAYEPRWFMKSQHINPEEAIKLHELVQSKMSIGIHWGTYHMGSYEYYLEPKEKLHEMMAQKPDANPFITKEMGVIWQEEADSSTNETSKSW